tara:strand:- start:9 stop:416 length:408 start_codon:yes stop_codon:yes gene_type:complete
MTEIFDDNGEVIHLVVNKSDFKKGRQDVINAEHFLQCALLNMDNGKTFKPHKHNWNKPDKGKVIAQESWVVIQGSVKCFFYDCNSNLVATHVLSAGDASFTLQGGHNYEILEDNTLVYEYKTGPYHGQELDKTFI